MGIEKVIVFKVYVFILFWFFFFNFLPSIMLNWTGMPQELVLYSYLTVIFFSIGFFSYLKLKWPNKIYPVNFFHVRMLYCIYVILLLMGVLVGNIIIPIYALYSAHFSIRLIQVKKYFSLCIVVLITFVFLLQQYTRMFILMYVLYFFMFYYLRSRKLYIVRALILAVIALVLLIGMLFYRVEKSLDIENIISIMFQGDSSFFLQTIDTYYVYEVYGLVVQNFPKPYDFLYGESLIKPLFFWIPRALWENKPQPLTSYIGNLFYGNTKGDEYSTGMTLTGEFYLNFGLPGVIVLSAIFGIITSFFLVKYISSTKEYIKILSLSYIIFIPHMVRGGVSTTIVTLFVFYTIISVLYKLRKNFNWE